jgi:hypothetical protein
MRQRYSTENVKEIVEQGTKNEYALLRVDEHASGNKKRTMRVRHNLCGHEYTLDIYEFIAGKRRCGKCKGKVLQRHFAYDREQIVQKTKSITNGEYEFIDDHYINANTKHTFKHITCETVFTKTWNKFRSGQRCPNCIRRGMDSMTFHYLKDILEHYEIDYEMEKRFKDCYNPRTNKQLAFDFYIKGSNLLIEIDGEQHERASYGMKAFRESRYRDNIKDRYVKDQDIELLRIPSNRWNRLPEVIAPYISRILGRNLSAADVAKIEQSNIPARINKDLKKIHNGEYILYDKFYTGVDREHRYKHLKCGYIFSSTYYRIGYYKNPCPQCRDENRMIANWKRANEELYERTQGKYSLIEGYETVRENGNKKYVRCNDCQNQWFVNLGAIYANNGGCPKCHRLKLQQQWEDKYNKIASLLRQGEPLSKHQKQWITYNKGQYKQEKLDMDKVRSLKVLDLI